MGPHLEHSVYLLWYFVIRSQKTLFWFILSKLSQKSQKFDFQNSVCMIFNWSKQGTFTKPIKLTSAEVPCFESTKRACTTLLNGIYMRKFTQNWLDNHHRSRNGSYSLIPEWKIEKQKSQKRGNGSKTEYGPKWTY